MSSANTVPPAGQQGLKGWVAVGALLSAGIGWALYALSVQLAQGPGVAGINRPVYWGLYVVQFVFLMGLAQGGILISALLRILNIEWRLPITRVGEMITGAAVLVGPTMILADLGRPQLFYRVLTEVNLSSALFWDMASIFVFQGAAMLYLYLSLVPDLALLRDAKASPLWLYRLLAWRYVGTEDNQALMRRAIRWLSIILLPIAVLEHGVVSSVFARTLIPVWHSVLLPPYFLTGAFLSGTAVCVLVLAVVRKVYRLEAVISETHFLKLGRILQALSWLWLVFTVLEFWLGYQRRLPAEVAILDSKLRGAFAVPLWGSIACCFAIPLFILAFRKYRPVAGLVVVSASVLVGMWLERFLIIVPALARPRLQVFWGGYTPTWVEAAICSGALCLFGFLMLIFCRFLPIVSLWEVNAIGTAAAADTGVKSGTLL